MKIMLNAQCSMLNAQCSMLNAQCSMLNAQCSMLNAQCSMVYINEDLSISQQNLKQTLINRKFIKQLTTLIESTTNKSRWCLGGLKFKFLTQNTSHIAIYTYHLVKG